MSRVTGPRDSIQICGGKVARSEHAMFQADRYHGFRTRGCGEWLSAGRSFDKLANTSLGSSGFPGRLWIIEWRLRAPLDHLWDLADRGFNGDRTFHRPKFSG